MEGNNPSKVGRFEIRKDLFDSRRNLNFGEMQQDETLGQRNDRLLQENLIQQENLRLAQLNSNRNENNVSNLNNLPEASQDAAAALPPINVTQGQVFTNSRFNQTTNPFAKNQRTNAQIRPRESLDESIYPGDVHTAATLDEVQNNLNNMTLSPIRHNSNGNANNNNNNNNRNFHNPNNNYVAQNFNRQNQKINDILQMTLLVPIFDSTESTLIINIINQHYQPIVRAHLPKNTLMKTMN